MYQGGYNYRFRRNMTDRIVQIYSNILKKHESGHNMYRNINIRKKSGNKVDWFRKQGYKWAFQAPVTINKELAKDVKTELEKFSGEKMMI